LFLIDFFFQETTNLADANPELVESLLAEAESAVSAAPGMIRGDVVYKHGLVGPQHDGFWSTLRNLGSVHTQVCEDDKNLAGKCSVHHQFEDG
jgi:hypothetical protein